MPDRDFSYVHTVVTESDRLAYPDPATVDSAPLEVCREDGKLRRGRFYILEPEPGKREGPISISRPADCFRVELVPIAPPFRDPSEATIVLRDLNRIRRIAMLLDLGNR